MFALDFFASVPDPTATDPQASCVEHAYCHVVEWHAHIDRKVMLFSVQCWRSEDARTLNRQPFAVVSVPMSAAEYAECFMHDSPDHMSHSDLRTTLCDFLVAKIRTV